MTKPTSKVKDRYNRKAYDSFLVRVPKGAKRAIEDAASARKRALNGFVADAIMAEMGITEWPIDTPALETSGDAQKGK